MNLGGNDLFTSFPLSLHKVTAEAPLPCVSGRPVAPHVFVLSKEAVLPALLQTFR